MIATKPREHHTQAAKDTVFLTRKALKHLRYVVRAASHQYVRDAWREQGTKDVDAEVISYLRASIDLLARAKTIVIAKGLESKP